MYQHLNSGLKLKAMDTELTYCIWITVSHSSALKVIRETEDIWNTRELADLDTRLLFARKMTVGVKENVSE